jgi:hypothetical protein
MFVKDCLITEAFFQRLIKDEGLENYLPHAKEKCIKHMKPNLVKSDE